MRLPLPGRLVDRYVCGCSLPLAHAQPFLPHFFSVVTSEPRINPASDPSSAMSASLVAAVFGRLLVGICNSLSGMLLSIPYTERLEMQVGSDVFFCEGGKRPRHSEAGGATVGRGR